MRRLLTYVARGFILLSASFLTFAGTPSSGTITVEPFTTTGTPSYTWTGPTHTPADPITYKTSFATSNPSGQAVAEGALAKPRCSPAASFPCDDFTLTVKLPAGYTAANPGTAVKIALSYPVNPSGQNPQGAVDYDIYVYDSTGKIVASGLDKNPLIVNLLTADGTNIYDVQIVPTTSDTSEITTVLTLVPGAQPVTGGGGSTAAPSTPRYQLYDPDSITPGNPLQGQNQGQGTSSVGEDNVGYDLKTGVIMNMNEVGNVYAIHPPELMPDPENISVKLPESCQAFWVNVSNGSGDTSQIASVDPILWTDQKSGRTFQSNATTGANAFFSYTDDDGQNWIPASASPPSGGADHQTIATGPYPAGSPFASVATSNGVDYATYFCSQTEIPDFCQRSDSGARDFGPGVAITDGTTNSCSGLHGHVKVSPYDGSVWVPIRNCGAVQGGSISKDAGLTWSPLKVTNSTPNTANNFDPSVALASDGTAYYCYVGTDSHPHVSVSPGHGATGAAPSDGASWIRDFDIGAQLNIKSAVFVEAVAGDPNRAACGFVGTTTPGDWSAAHFLGVWKLYIANTVDGGQTWTTVDVAPDNIVQAAGSICNQGTTCPSFRNLLDFNEVTMDKYGRVIFAFDQGCVGDKCQSSPTEANNTQVANQRIARQSGGLTLLSQYDSQANNGDNPASGSSGVWAPKPPCLAGVKDTNKASLSWLPGDSGGGAITSYKVFRSQVMGGENPSSPLATLAPQTGAPPTAYIDNTIATLPPGPIYYTVQGINAQGTSVFSNEILVGTPAASGNACVLPGVTLSTGSSGTAVSGGVFYAEITSLQAAEPDPDPIAAGSGSYSFTNPTASNQSTALTFTINVASFNNLTAPPANTSWTVQWNMPGSCAPATCGTQDGSQQTLFMSFDTYNNSGADPTGEISFGHIDNTTTPHSNVTECTWGLTSGPTLASTCQASGTYNPSANSITLTLDTHASIPIATVATGSTQKAFTVSFNSASGLPTLTAVTGIVQQLVGGTGTGLISNIDTTPASSYAVGGNWACRPAPSLPIAALALSPGDGVAPADGLAETLDASGSTASSGTAIATYTFTPGDGSADQTQPSASYAYSYPVGVFSPRVSVTTDGGQTSTNNTTKALIVTPLPPTGVTATAIGSDEIDLSWTPTASKLSPGATALYDVYWSLSSGGEAGPATSNPQNVKPGISANGTKITGLSAGTKYYFTVYTMAGPGHNLPSVASAEASATTAAATTVGPGPSASSSTIGNTTVGAFALAGLLPLSLAALARRRRLPIAQGKLPSRRLAP